MKSLISSFKVGFSMSAILFLSSFSEARQILLVSDLDDTIKITHVGSTGSMVANEFWHRLTFLGMQDLYSELMNHNKAEQAKDPMKFVYLSAFPDLLLSRVRHFITETNKFPGGDFIARSTGKIVKGENPFDFKSEELEELGHNNPEADFLLIGDDTEFDPEVYDGFQKKFGESRVLGIYIHQINRQRKDHGTDRKLPETVEPNKPITPYLTAFEVALKEVENSRLSPEQAVRIGRGIIDQNRPDLLIPDYMNCPHDQEFWKQRSKDFEVGERGSSSGELKALSQEYFKYVQGICMSRK